MCILKHEFKVAVNIHFRVTEPVFISRLRALYPCVKKCKTQPLGLGDSINKADKQALNLLLQLLSRF